MRRLAPGEGAALAAEELRALPADARGCPLCAGASGHGAPEVLAQSASAIALLDRYPSREGHIVVVTRAHVTRVAELREDDWLDVQRLSHRAVIALERVLAPRRVFVAALGSAEPLATSFPHVHVHVVPVAERGEDARPARVFSWSAGVLRYEGDEEARLAAKLRAAWG